MSAFVPERVNRLRLFIQSQPELVDEMCALLVGAKRMLANLPYAREREMATEIDAFFASLSERENAFHESLDTAPIIPNGKGTDDDAA